VVSCYTTNLLDPDPAESPSEIMADSEGAKTRKLDYGADEFGLRPMSTENVADNVFNLITIDKKTRLQ
jgi:hypothetical protein